MISWLRAEAAYLSFEWRIRVYCYACDRIGLRLRHGRCNARNRAAGLRLLDGIGPELHRRLSGETGTPNRDVP